MDDGEQQQQQQQQQEQNRDSFDSPLEYSYYYYAQMRKNSTDGTNRSFGGSERVSLETTTTTTTTTCVREEEEEEGGMEASNARVETFSDGGGGDGASKDDGDDEEEEVVMREITPYRPTYSVGKIEGGEKRDSIEEEEEEKFASMEEEFTHEAWWESTTMRDENAAEFIVNIEDEEETRLSPEEVVYEEDEDWYNRPVDERSITGIRLPVVVQNVSYRVKHKTKKNEMIKLLNEVSVVFQPCRVTALMGPSGAGKTTLLDVIAGRKTQGTLEGQIFVGEKISSAKVLKSCAAYVEQFDNLLPTLTVRETLLYAAELKRPNVKEKWQAAIAAEQRVKDVDKLLDTLQLR